MIRKRKSSFKPRLEPLEDRRLLSFGADGIVHTSFNNSSNGGDDYAQAVALQADGRIVAVGYTATYTNNGRDIAVARYNVGGGLDSSFDGDGKVTTEVTRRGWDETYAVALQADGKIIAGGNTGASSSSNIPPNDQDWALVRYRTNGALDSSFGNGGKVRTDMGTNLRASITSLTVQPWDGKIIAAGSSQLGTSWALTLVRYNTNGSLDSSFGTDGKVTSPDVPGAAAVALDSSGRIVVAGSGFVVLRYNTNGTLDSSFGTGGKVDIDFGFGSEETPRALAIDAGGRIVVAGYVFGTRDFSVARLNPDGSLDTTFDSDGKVTTDFASTTDLPFAMAVDAAGKIVVAGSSVGSSVGGYYYRDFALVRYNTDGSLDTTFDNDGKVITDATRTGKNDQAYAVALQPDGKIIAAGHANDGGGLGFNNFALVRYNSDGSLDSGTIAAATAVRQSSPTVTGRYTRAVTSIVTIPSHEHARHHAARTEAADQAIASLLGSATRRRFGPSRRLDLDAELLADIALLA